MLARTIGWTILLASVGMLVFVSVANADGARARPFGRYAEIEGAVYEARANRALPRPITPPEAPPRSSHP